MAAHHLSSPRTMVDTHTIIEKKGVCLFPIPSRCGIYQTATILLRRAFVAPAIATGATVEAGDPGANQGNFKTRVRMHSAAF